MKMRKLVSVLLCAAMLLTFGLTAAAAENVSFLVELDKTAIEESDEEQTVVMTLKATTPITLDGMGMTVTGDLPIASMAGGEKIASFNQGHYNTDDGSVVWSTPDSENVTGVTTIVEVTFTVPAGAEPGEYTLGICDLELSSDYGEVWAEDISAETTLTIIDVPEVTSYCASLSTTTPDVTREEQVSVSVAVTHVEETVFHAGELVLGYDPTYLTFNEEASQLGGASVKAEEGTLTLEDYGAAKNCGSGVYVLVFDTSIDGNTQVQLLSCAFSNQENAASGDLIEGVVYPDTVKIAIGKKNFAVTLPAGLSGAASVVEGSSYTFSIADENYIYTDVAATVDGEAVEVTENEDGTYTVAEVTGVLKVTVTATPKSYGVSFAGSGLDDITGSGTATYGAAYSFSIPTVTGWAYSLDSVTIGGEAYTGYSAAGGTYTIPGAAITGEIVITVTKTQVSTSVTVDGSGAGAAAGYSVSANIGQDYTLTIAPEAGYSYTVTATMGGEAVELTQSGNSYTVSGVMANLVFTVERAAIVDHVTADAYVTINGAKVWLVQNTVTVAEGKVPTYNGEPMFWSEIHNAYCALVIAENLDEETAKANSSIGEGTAVTVTNDMDVNMTGKVDANDAQLTYDIYNAVYSEFTETVTAEKFLKADVNRDGQVDVQDAAAIIAFILD